MPYTADSSRRQAGWQGMNWIYRPRREAIYARDEDTCCYCNRRWWNAVRKSLDHIIPVALGGTNDSDNLVLACLACNDRKRDLSVKDFAEYLRRQSCDARSIYARIKERMARPIDMAEGRRRLGLAA